MARDQARVVCPVGVWTELTNGDITTLTFQVEAGSVKLRATTGSAPSDLSDPGYIFHANPTDPQVEDKLLRVAISDLAAAAGAVRVFASPISGRRATVIVDHA